MKYIVLGILWFVLAGCIKEDLSECNQRETGLVLKYRYAVPLATEKDADSAEIDRLSVFIFDEEGLFLSQINDSLIRIDDNYTMELPYKEGQFQFVVWAGFREESYRLPDRIQGETHIDDFILYLKRGEDHFVTNRPALLYHGLHETVELKPDEKKVVWIDLRRITNNIRVIARDLNPELNHTIQIVDDNGAYDASGNFANDDTIIYVPRYTSKQENEVPLIADFTVMKLATGKSPHLRIVDERGTVRYNENLIGKLIGENPTINFEYDHDFVVEIAFSGYVPVSIKINGWEIIEEVTRSSSDNTKSHAFFPLK